MAKIDEKSTAVQSHLTIMQSIIQRMAANSNSCKTACITLVSAILVIIADKNKPDFAWIALIPSSLFFVLDAYYLGLEKSFRECYNNFIEKLHNSEITTNDLFVVSPQGNRFCATLYALSSFSIWPFYVALIVMVYISYRFIF